MAENLLLVAGPHSPNDRQFGLDWLRKLARPADDYGVEAARVLERYGDLSPVEWYHDEWQRALSTRGRTWDYTTQAIFYVADHAERKEWELLRQIALHDQQRAADPRSGRHAFVLGSLLNSPQAETSPYAIPLLGLALEQARDKGSRYVNENVGSRPSSSADVATEYLQRQTGEDFGYRRTGTNAERAAAIERAQKWWADEGEYKYTFDAIERMVRTGRPP
jgi:hypothetical protein